MSLKILLVILAFFLQPLLWIGLIRSYLDSCSRMKRTRSQFNTAIYEKRYELRHFWLSLLLIGIIVSCVSGLVEVNLSLNWVLIYELLASLSLILIPSGVIPVLVLVASSLAVLLLNLSRSSLIAGQNYLLITGLVILALGIFLGLNGGRYDVPRIYRNQRDNRVAGYPFKELSIVPMLVMIPGNAVQHLISFYPTFVVNGHRISFLLVPILLGLRLTIFKNVSRIVFKRLSSRFMALGIAGMLMAIISYKWPGLIVYGLVVLLLLSGLILYTGLRFDRKHGKWCSEVINGVRVVGIEPKTPASRMNLHVGDVILNVNGISVTDEDHFYEALQKQPTYCRLRVLNRNDRIILTSTAIYSGSPHEIGVVLFRNSNV